MSHYLVKLRFVSPVRFGADLSGIGIEEAQPYIHSDTLFSAFCNVFVKFGILKDSQLQEFGNQVSISSTFFFSNNFNFKATPVFFLPKPKIPCSWLEKLNSDRKKELEKILKKAQWVPSAMFEHWLNPSPPKDVFSEKPDELINFLAYDTLYKEELITKHAQDRLTAASNIFYQTQYRFKYSDCGLFFLVSFMGKKSEQDFKYKFSQGLKALSQVGIGGERNFGFGRFEVRHGFGELMPINDTPLRFLFSQNLPDIARQRQCLLSLSLPTKTEIEKLQSGADKQEAYYELTPRRGWTFSSATPYQMKRQTVSMFSEGSVFTSDVCPKGSIVNLAPLNSSNEFDYPHPVYRYGKTFAVPLKSFQEKRK